MNEVSVKVKYFTFVQNNSGGGFGYNEGQGIGHYVIVEALNAAHANARAREIGIYFDGVNNGTDCECCGDRWHEQWGTGAGTDAPEVYGKSPEDFISDDDYIRWGMDKQIFVHYINGEVQAF